MPIFWCFFLHNFIFLPCIHTLLSVANSRSLRCAWAITNCVCYFGMNCAAFVISTGDTDAAAVNPEPGLLLKQLEKNQRHSWVTQIQLAVETTLKVLSLAHLFSGCWAAECENVLRNKINWSLSFDLIRSFAGTKCTRVAINSREMAAARGFWFFARRLKLRVRLVKHSLSAAHIMCHIKQKYFTPISTIAMILSCVFLLS